MITPETLRAAAVEAKTDGRPYASHLLEQAANAIAALTAENARLKAILLGDFTLAVDAAMIEMKNISPPLRRSECERLLRAALKGEPK